MKVAVIGAGIVGVTTAYELARQGHSVTVFERHGSVGEETSFANAGVIAPGYVTPCAAPFGQLHRCRANPACGSRDQDPLTRLNAAARQEILSSGIGAGKACQLGVAQGAVDPVGISGGN